MNTEIEAVAVEELEPKYPEPGDIEVKIAGRLLLIASIIVNVVEGDTFLVIGSVLNIIAGLFTIKAARLEAVDQQIAPGVTTFANGLKLIGSHTSLIISLLLFWALLIEINAGQPVGTAAKPTLAGQLGAFMV